LEAKIPGAVTQPGQPIMQVTPDEALTVRLQVANADIANLRPGLPVDIRVDAYPITEFGSLRGSVTQVGSDAVASENASQPSFFPVEVQIDPLSLQPQGDGKELTLTPGMTVTGNVKTGQRSPISFVAEQILRAIDELKAS
jgi:HlyD family secretion protein